MSLSSLRILFFPLLLLIIVPLVSGDDDLPPEWCVVDVQVPDDVLQGTLNWICGDGGANCTMIQENQPCYLPNTVQDHASYAFNNYYQKFKHQGASCYFNGAAIITSLDPSHDNCHFESLP